MGKLILGDAGPVVKRQPKKSVDLICSSPPYPEKGERYGPGSKKWPTDEWVGWMAGLTMAALPVVRNAVIWIVNGTVADGRYLPACEGLVWLLHSNGIRCERPVIWSKNAPPNRKDYFANSWEFCLVFRPEDSTCYFDWEAIAQAPKYTSGGQFRQRDAKGKRKLGSTYPQNKLARPKDMLEADLDQTSRQEEGIRAILAGWDAGEKELGSPLIAHGIAELLAGRREQQEARDIVRATVGGGHMGSKLAHLNHAPFPEKLVRPFLQAMVPKKGTVMDCFCGSGTTLSVAEQLGLNWIGSDSDKSQIELSQRRIKEIRAKMKGAASG